MPNNIAPYLYHPRHRRPPGPEIELHPEDLRRLVAGVFVEWGQ